MTSFFSTINALASREHHQSSPCGGKQKEHYSITLIKKRQWVTIKQRWAFCHFESHLNQGIVVRQDTQYRRQHDAKYGTLMALPHQYSTFRVMRYFILNPKYLRYMVPLAQFIYRSQIGNTLQRSDRPPAIWLKCIEAVLRSDGLSYMDPL